MLVPYDYQTYGTTVITNHYIEQHSIISEFSDTDQNVTYYSKQRITIIRWMVRQGNVLVRSMHGNNRGGHLCGFMKICFQTSLCNG